MSRHLRQLDVQKAVAGAIKGGMAPGSFRVRVDAERGVIDLLPMNDSGQPDDDGVDAEIRALLNGNS